MSARSQSTLDTGEVIQDPQIGDYPNLPRWSHQSRGPFGWWDPQDKRNFGETVSLFLFWGFSLKSFFTLKQVHEEDEVMGVWAPDLHTYSPYKAAAQLAMFAGVIASFVGVVYATYPDRPAVSERVMMIKRKTDRLVVRSSVLILKTV
jgi:NADH dehydrogenase (ubiquinone) 1 beta subcomplex subunit 8